MVAPWAALVDQIELSEVTMLQRWLIGCLVLAMLLIRQPVVAHIATAPLTIQRHGQRLQINLQLPKPNVSANAIKLAGWQNDATADQPALPRSAHWLVVPTGYRLQLRSAVANDLQAYRQQLQLNQTSGWQVDPLQPSKAVATSTPSTALKQAQYPAAWASLGQVVQVREQVLVPLTIFGAQWQPAKQQLFVPSSIDISLEFVADAPQRRLRPDPLWNELLRQQVLNPSDLTDLSLKPQLASSVPLTTGLRVSFAQPGISEIRWSDLQAAGVPSQWINQAANLQLWQGRKQLPRLLTATGMVFYLPPYNRDQSHAGSVIVRWNSQQAGTVLVSESVNSASPSLNYYNETLRLEEQKLYLSAFPASGTNRWWWQYWYSPGAGQTAQPLQINWNLDSATRFDQPARLRLRLHGGNLGNRHQAEIWLNNRLLTTVTMTGHQLLEPTISVPSGWLSPTNQLTIAPIGNERETSFLDWVELDYQRQLQAVAGELQWSSTQPNQTISNISSENPLLFDVQMPFAPRRLVGWNLQQGQLSWQTTGNRRYLVQSQRQTPLGSTWFSQPDLSALNQQADYLVLSYNPANSSSWSNALQPLLDQRARQGLKPLLIDVQHIYDQFGDGRVDQQAIAEFIKYAYANWQAPAPSFVLLVGDGTADPHDYADSIGHPVTNFIPPYLADVDPWLRETAADNRYVTVAGSDNLPDLFLGRIPARSLSDVENVVNKILSYEATPSDASWLNNLLFIADDPDQSGDFPALSNEVVEILPTTIDQQLLYYTPNSNLTQFRAEIVNAINSGQFLVNYVGHAGIDVWAEPAIFTQQSVANLNNTALPLVLSLSCYAGHYQQNDLESLAEMQLLKQQRGAVGIWAASGLGIAHGHDHLDRGFVNAIINDGWRVVGPATIQGKLDLAAANISPDLLDTFTFFGDPALRVPLPALNTWQPSADYFEVLQYSQANRLTPLANDQASFSQIISFEQPQHGRAWLDADQQSIRYTPDPIYNGLDTFSYQVRNLSLNQSLATTVTISVTAIAPQLYLPLTVAAP
ncbi:C25 family cysteine peptidase [Herpetosiphon geysericola]|uniref:Gingipain domain-containing protein n=1 Tax=Herpetosiphon geysericola TaxID=70996 RepID=A0A0P6XRV2_9CHLR|nr:C25 family cysteine peptidase [Herpetosiphon geysericola]KPL85408.1 hypothetical protein SE18_17335 [Herpetosiphon geysericola]